MIFMVKITELVHQNQLLHNFQQTNID